MSTVPRDSGAAVVAPVVVVSAGACACTSAGPDESLQDASRAAAGRSASDPTI